MGYDLHLTRASDWGDSDEAPISLDDWLAFARSSSALTETMEISTGDGIPVFLLGSNPRVDPALYWSRGRVTVRGAHDAHVQALVAVASNLGVRLLGDDDELYE